MNEDPWFLLLQKKDRILVFSDIDFKKAEVSLAFGFLMIFNRSSVGAGSRKGPKDFSSQESEAKQSYFALKKAKENGFPPYSYIVGCS